MLGRRHVLPSVVSTLTELMVEGTFPMGTYLVTVHNPIATDEGNLEKALYGSFFPVPLNDLFPALDPSVYQPENAPGAVVVVKHGVIKLSPGRRRIRLRVTSKGDRPIQVCIHPTRNNNNELVNLPVLKWNRLGLIITLSRRTPNYNSIESKPMDIPWTYLPELRYGLNLETQRL